MDIYSMNKGEATTLHLKLIFRLTNLLIEPYFGRSLHSVGSSTYFLDIIDYNTNIMLFSIQSSRFH